MKQILILSDINSTHTQKWVISLTKEGHQIMLFSFTNPLSNWYDSLPNFNFTCLNKNKKYKKRTLLSKINYFKSISILKKTYRNFSPDIVHSHYASSYGLMGTFFKPLAILCISLGIRCFYISETFIYFKVFIKKSF